jgi:outer membrane protein assembly factor BamB
MGSKRLSLREFQMYRQTMSRPVEKCAVALLLAFLGMTGSVAGDWSQWRGPERTAVVQNEAIRTEFATPPKLLWTFRSAGAGYSSPSVVGNVVYCLGADEESDFANAINLETGEQIWKTKLGPVFRESRGNGPRGSPTIDGSYLFCVRGGGEIHCLNTKDGKQVWSKSSRRDFGGKLMSGWGYSESPLVDGDHVIFTPGGDGAMVALRKATGETVWRAQGLSDDAAHSSPIVAEPMGVRQYINLTRRGVAGVRASDGKLLWFYARTQNVAAIPTPVYHDHHVFVTSGYGSGCDLIRLTKEGEEFKAEKVYHNKDMINHHGGVVLIDGFIYGHSYEPRREAPGWACLDFKTGAMKWKLGNKRPGKGAVIAVNHHLFCYDEDTGIVHVGRALPDGWKETGQIKPPTRSSIRTRDNKFWAHPVVANGRLLIRDQDLIFCYDLRP